MKAGRALANEDRGQSSRGDQPLAEASPWSAVIRQSNLEKAAGIPGGMQRSQFHARSRSVMVPVRPGQGC